jgi:enamine deaminase RidA (YjgF/YER057c/UK114 family)
VDAERRLSDLGLELPAPTPPVASYVPVVVAGSLAFVAGQIPMVQGELRWPGKLGLDVDIEAGAQAARQCALNALAALRAELGSLDRIRRIVKLTVFVASAEGFTNQPKVANGASDLMADVFGDAGKHARAAVGVAELPLGSAVEVEVVAELEP